MSAKYGIATKSTIKKEAINILKFIDKNKARSETLFKLVPEFHSYLDELEPSSITKEAATSSSSLFDLVIHI